MKFISKLLSILLMFTTCLYSMERSEIKQLLEPLMKECMILMKNHTFSKNPLSLKNSCLLKALPLIIKELPLLAALPQDMQLLFKGLIERNTLINRCVNPFCFRPLLPKQSMQQYLEKTQELTLIIKKICHECMFELSGISSPSFLSLLSYAVQRINKKVDFAWEKYSTLLGYDNRDITAIMLSCDLLPVIFEAQDYLFLVFIFALQAENSHFISRVRQIGSSVGIFTDHEVEEENYFELLISFTDFIDDQLFENIDFIDDQTS